MAINVLTVSGNIGKDCELRYTANNKAIGSFSLPVKSGWGDNEKTSWLTCKLFGKQAEAISQYLVKGAKVTVTGEFVEEKWNDQQGQERSMNCLLVRDVELPAKPQSSGGHQQPARQAPQQQAPADFDDSIPFAPIGLQFADHAIHVI